MPRSILIVDDEEAIAWALRRAFEKAGYAVTVTATAEDALKKAAAEKPDAVFLDVRLPGMDGLTALGKIRAIAPAAAIVVMTAHGNLATAVKAVEGGAFDYLAKPFDLQQALDAAARATAATPNGPTAPPPPRVDDEILGKSAAMQVVFKRIALVAPTDAGVLITGESGTGKELVARAVHANSSRRDKPFLPVHVAALNPNLVESELFGHVRGSFTGADRNRDGLLTLATGGTVFLDEVADIPLPVQAKLLRVLERQEVMPVGGAVSQPVNVRIVSATHVDLSAAVAEGRFRHDLFFRLNVYPIHVPALRDRTDDIPLLAETFLHRFAATATLSSELKEVLVKRLWPGNVRELRNALEHAAINGRGGLIRPEHLPDPTTNVGPQPIREQMSRIVREWVAEKMAAAGKQEPNELYQALLDEVEPALVGEILRQLDGNRLAAGRWLGLARATVRKLIRKHGLAPDAEGDDAEG
ncbi:sigma-54-dependent transcriptional regulator [Limnoglobus roseus]|uniref:DNA-binding transcriptional regulator NtrC n=1 Tax=Limnoglobus roseus TaxID=2598579 RepID=A0A5C1A566_9BACT|nr:sigma-54 dependent transcriptional regulator [Limnoglobus roseus]QEL13156.1 sigma-54-dependent Fis family transcriptional regulator [Limnoglobus roseus]